MNRLAFVSTAALAAALTVLFAFNPASAHATSFGFAGGIVDYTVLTSGTYDVVAAGAQGGSDHYSPGGMGAILGGDIFLTSGTVLKIAVGGQGGTGSCCNISPVDAGGGGGSFVVYSNNTPLLIAGGGGGADYYPNQSGQPGLTVTSGGNGQTQNGCGGGSVTAAGGTNGNGGAGGAYCNDNASPSTGGGSGAGFYSNGGKGGDNWPQFCSAAGGGNDWANGLGGGGGSGCFNGGGGGGYGGGGGSSAEGGGGGGGGYSGGGGGAGGGSDSAGGGGGSFSVSGLILNLSESGANSGNGYVDIDFISAATPEPSSFFLLGTGLLSLAGIVRRRRQYRQTHRLPQSLS